MSCSSGLRNTEGDTEVVVDLTSLFLPSVEKWFGSGLYVLMDLANQSLGGKSVIYSYTKDLNHLHSEP